MSNGLQHSIVHQHRAADDPLAELSGNLPRLFLSMPRLSPRLRAVPEYPPPPPEKYLLEQQVTGPSAVAETRDVVVHWYVDLTLLTRFGQELSFIDALLTQYSPRHPDSAQFGPQSRVLLLNLTGRLDIDISFGALPFASRAIAIRHDKKLDWRYIEEQLTPLAQAKEEPEILQHLNRLRNLNSTL